ncbi:transcriptional regulator, XRE family, partial [Reticulomyxa filosa]
WDIRSGQQIQVFNGHNDWVYAVEYSPFVINDSSGKSNVICSGSDDNTIRFWDIRSNKSQLYVMKLDEGIYCLKFVVLKKKENTNNVANDLTLCYGLKKEMTCFFFEKLFVLEMIGLIQKRK